MIYISFNTDTWEFQTATNIAALGRVTGVPYYKLYRRLSNGTGAVKYEGFIFGKTSELLKGNQRLPGDKKNKEDPNYDFFKDIK